MRNMKTSKGFTLVELSIVLVIIGLLIGGILVAQSMISTATQQRFYRTLQQYEVAMNNFITNYKVLPGDSKFFDPPGDANGILNGPDPMSYCIECHQIFAHLSQSGMLSETYVPSDPDVNYGWPVDRYSEVGTALPFTQFKHQSSDPIYGGPGKLAINISSYANAYAFDFYLKPIDAIAITQKLGNVTSGVGAGNCVYGYYEDYSVSCTDPLADAGHLYYKLNLAY